MTDGPDRVRDEVEPDDDWVFDDDVARSFDDMLARSIPQYEAMRHAVFCLQRTYMPFTDGRLLDLGTSRGESVARIIDEIGQRGAFVLVETAPAMLRAVRERYGSRDCVTILDHDLRRDVPQYRSDVVQSILTLQFTPINYRQRIVQSAYDALRSGGAFILVEKVLGATYALDKTMVTHYHALKQDHGYTYDDVERKRESLEGVLVPVTAAWNEDLLRQAGFRHVDCFWRWMNFAGWVAVKE
jgi:tRNA (cmo5U34)-methyltransferase